jgi:transcriptional regulator NrdR family protein
MECPSCKKSEGVTVTHSSRILGNVRRRRYCPNCRTVFYTWEINEKDLTVKVILKTIERLTSRLTTRKEETSAAPAKKPHAISSKSSATYSK